MELLCRERCTVLAPRRPETAHSASAQIAKSCGRSADSVAWESVAEPVRIRFVGEPNDASTLFDVLHDKGFAVEGLDRRQMPEHGWGPELVTTVTVSGDFIDIAKTTTRHWPFRRRYDVEVDPPVDA